MLFNNANAFFSVSSRSSWIAKREMRKTKQRPWIGNSGLGSLDYPKTIFTGLGSLDFPTKKFHRSWIAKSGLWSLTKKNLRRRNKQRVFSGSSHSELCCKKSVLKYLVKLTGKHLCRSLFLANRRETLLKKRLLHKCFPTKFIRAAFS